MASDEDYASFLDQANAPMATASAQSSSQSQTKAIDMDVPAQIRSIDRHYVSEADEPFTPVSLKWGTSLLPSEKDFAALIEHKRGDVSILALEEWDAKGKYGDIVKSVAEAAGVKQSDVRVYRIESGGARVEYWVVALDRREGRVVGLKALAIES